MKKFLIFAVLIGIAMMLIAGTIEQTSADALYDAVGDTTIVDTVTISNDLYETDRKSVV